MESYYLRKKVFELLEWMSSRSQIGDLQGDYFAKQKRKQVEEQKNSIIVKRREGKDSGARGGK